MKLRQTRKPQDNRMFNLAVSPLINALFEPRNAGPIGYIPTTHKDLYHYWPSGVYQKVGSDRYQPTVVVLPNDQETIPKKSIVYNVESLGPYEVALLATLCYAGENTWALTGAVGAGKTVTSNYVLKFINRNLSTPDFERKGVRPLQIKLDFNVGIAYADEDIDKVIRYFTSQLYLTVLSNIKEVLVHKIDLLMDRISSCEDILKWLLPFKLKHVDDDNWYNLSNQNRVERLMKWIENIEEETPFKLSILASVIRFLKSSMPNQPGAFIIFIDNIDVLIEKAQGKILNYVMRFARECDMTALVTLRYTTFGTLAATATFRYGQIRHLGISIETLLARRIKGYFDLERRSDELNRICIEIDKNYLAALNGRMKEILKLISKSDSRTAKRIAAMTGASLRRGLELCKRFFINNVVPYDREDVAEDDLMRSLLINTNDDFKIRSEDTELVNLFIDEKSKRVSLLNVRVLQFVIERGEEREASVSELIDFFRETGLWDDKELCNSLNYLLRMTTRIIWIENKRGFTVESLGEEARENVYPTLAGERYYSTLFRDFTYLQEAFLECDWPEDSGLPREVDLNTWSERILFLIKCFRVLLSSDIGWLKKIDEKKIGKRYPFMRNLIVADILAKCSRDVRRIQQYQYRASDSTEQDWINLMILTEYYCEKMNVRVPESLSEEMVKFGEMAAIDLHEQRSGYLDSSDAKDRILLDLGEFSESKEEL